MKHLIVILNNTCITQSVDIVNGTIEKHVKIDPRLKKRIGIGWLIQK